MRITLAQAEDLRLRYQQISTKFAGANSDWRPDSPATGELLFVAPDEYSPAPAIESAISEARQKHADELFSLAKEAAEAGQTSLAFQWATETVRENPNHAEARRVLGYVERDGKWLTPYGARMYDVGKVWDSKRGWVPTAERTAEGGQSPFAPRTPHDHRGDGARTVPANRRG